MSAEKSDGVGEDCHDIDDADVLGGDDGGGGDELVFQHPGIPKEYAIIQYRTMPETGFVEQELNAAFKRNDIERLKLTPDDVTTTAALLMLFPEQYQSHTRARKDCRKRKILIHRGSLGSGDSMFARDRLVVGRVIDRVKSGDTVCIQQRMQPNYDECKLHDKEPPFQLPVVFEDDHFAVVNKPEGVVVFSHKNGGYGRMSVKACLPWVLSPPRAGTVAVIRRPHPVHRIDRGTSGLLVIAKTKPAMTQLAMDFKDRKVMKTYTAVLSGDIKAPDASSISASAAKQLGVSIENGALSEWQLIDEELEGQTAVTIWRPLKQAQLEHARNNTITMVELKPKTGRYHQLRRHMASVSGCPLLGDKTYDGGGPAKHLRENGFYLCSNRVSLPHPYFNSIGGKQEWMNVRASLLGDHIKDGSKYSFTEVDGLILFHAEIGVPPKFSEFSWKNCKNGEE